MTLGIVCNPHNMNPPNHFIKSGKEQGIPLRMIDLPTVAITFGIDGNAAVADRYGLISVDSLAPYLLVGYSVAVHALRILLRHAFAQNPVDGVLIADDKAATSERLSYSSVAQVPTRICSLDLEHAFRVASSIGYPVILKRTHGAEGRWVRRAHGTASLVEAFHELSAEGHCALIIQPEITEFLGRSIRVVVTGGRFLAATERTASGSEWRSNIACGATQRTVELSLAERTLAEQAASAVGLGHAGIDLLRSTDGPLVLEVNSCPDFTSMLPYFAEDLTKVVIAASMS